MISDVRLIAVTIMCLYIQIVQSENVTIDIASAKPYICGETLQLKCTYTGSRSCCSDFNRKWTVDEKDLMTNGNLEPFAEGKYKEGAVEGDYFILLIKNLENADMSEKKYTCQYAFEDMNPTTKDGSCLSLSGWKEIIGYLASGNVAEFIISVIVIVIVTRRCPSVSKFLKGWKKKWLGAFSVYVISSLFPINVIAGLAGFYGNIDKPWLMILIGFLIGLVAIVVAGYFYYIEIFNRAVFAPLLILTIVEAIVIGIVEFVVIENYLKGQCDRCGGRSTGWAALAIVVTTAIMIIVLGYFKGLTVRTFGFACLIVARNLVVSVSVAVPFGIYLCPCDDWTDPLFAIHGVVYSFILLGVFWRPLDTEEDLLLIGLLSFGGLGIFFPILFCAVYGGKRIIKANVGEKSVALQCPLPSDFKKEKITWFRNKDEVAKGTAQDSEIKFKITETGDLCITNVQKEDAGIYECASSGAFGTGARLKLSVTSGKNQSVESGSPEKERADKKKERKPTEVVRPQPSRPLPSRAQHLKTDNTGREEYSAENELFKPRPLPSISGHSDSPRPLPKRTPDDQLEKGGIQLEPLVDSTSEKKKKKKRKKKETKQSDEDD